MIFFAQYTMDNDYYRNLAEIFESDTLLNATADGKFDFATAKPIMQRSIVMLERLMTSGFDNTEVIEPSLQAYIQSTMIDEFVRMMLKHKLKLSYEALAAAGASLILYEILAKPEALERLTPSTIKWAIAYDRVDTLILLRKYIRATDADLLKTASNYDSINIITCLDPDYYSDKKLIEICKTNTLEEALVSTVETDFNFCHIKTIRYIAAKLKPDQKFRLCENIRMTPETYEFYKQRALNPDIQTVAKFAAVHNYELLEFMENEKIDWEQIAKNMHLYQPCVKRLVASHLLGPAKVE